MQAPFFYTDSFSQGINTLVLDEENSRHAVQVLRLTKGDTILLTDGKGHLLTAKIIEDHRKHCEVSIESIEFFPRSEKQVTLAISLLKNRNRFEWLLEKTTELGVAQIIPLRCARTEKETARMDRMEAVLISALLQSRQVWLPELKGPVNFNTIRDWKLSVGSNFIAYCEEVPKKPLGLLISSVAPKSLICIGPEGDFTPEEFAQALEENFTAVSLGNTRLRTETAGVAAVSVLSLC
jgi:16S rRNA (uracil1498-N3)-methyltransferase